LGRKMGYKAVKIREDVHSELWRIIGELQSERGRRITLSEALEMLIKRWRES